MRCTICYECFYSFVIFLDQLLMKIIPYLFQLFQWRWRWPGLQKNGNRLRLFQTHELETEEERWGRPWSWKRWRSSEMMQSRLPRDWKFLLQQQQRLRRLTRPGHLRRSKRCWLSGNSWVLMSGGVVQRSVSDRFGIIMFFFLRKKIPETPTHLFAWYCIFSSFIYFTSLRNQKQNLLYRVDGIGQLTAGWGRVENQNRSVRPESYFV